MTDHTELRKLAEAATRYEFEPKDYVPPVVCRMDFKDACTPATILSLLDRLEKAEKDAERMDWLNLAGNRFSFHLSGTWYSRKDHGSPYRKHANIRLAIDSAMEASK